MNFKALSLSALLLLGACGYDDNDNTASDRQDQLAADKELEKLQAKVDELEDALEQARANVTESKSELARGDADARAAAEIAEAKRAQLESDLADAKAMLAEATAKLDSQDYAEALAKLNAASTLLERLEQTRRAAPSTLGLKLGLKFGAEVLELDHAYTVGGGTLSVAALRYWLTNVALVRPDDTQVSIPNSYYLMGANKAQSLENGTQKPLTLPAEHRELVSLQNVPPGDYKAVILHVGVDAAHNDDLSLPGGELNVLRNMAGYQWMWFTSYIFTKLQGTFTSSTAGAAALPVRWENGTNDDLRQVRIELPSPVSVALEAAPQINLTLDAQKLLTGLDPATVGVNPQATTPASVIGASDAANRTILADNWVSAISLESVGTSQ